MRSQLPEFVLGLYDLFGPVQPRPQGNVYTFKFVVPKSTYQKTLKQLTQVFQEHGHMWVSLSIKPGPEKPEPWNRLVEVTVDKHALIPGKGPMP